MEIGINSEILAQILDGRKTVEGRLAKGKFLTIKPGDIISIREDIYHDGAIKESHNSAASLRVHDVKKFHTFKEMLKEYGYLSAIPSAKNLEDACEEYQLYYSPADEKAYGVLGISFNLLSS